MNHHSRKKWGFLFLLLALSLTGCNDEGAFEVGDNGAHGGDHAAIIAQTYEVTVNSAGDGEVSPAKKSVSAGDSSVFSVKPHEGSMIDSVSVKKGDCPLKYVTTKPLDDGQVNYTVGPVNSDCAIDVKFKDSSTTIPAHLLSEVSIIVTPIDGGKIHLEDGEPGIQKDFYLEPDESREFWVEANDSYLLKEITIKPSDSGNCIINPLHADEQFSVKSLFGDCHVTVEFENVTAPLEPQMHRIIYNIEGDASINNPVHIRVMDGEEFNFSVTPGTHSSIVGVTGDSCAVQTTDSENNYTVGPVRSDCTITVKAEEYYSVLISARDGVTVNNIEVFNANGEKEDVGIISSNPNTYYFKVSPNQYVTFKHQFPIYEGMLPLVESLNCDVGDVGSDGAYETSLIDNNCFIRLSLNKTCESAGAGPADFTSMDTINDLIDDPTSGKGMTIVLNDLTIRRAVENQSDDPSSVYESLLSPERDIIFETSCVTDMSSLFKNERAFNEDITYWNTGNVTTMKSMFDGARLFNQNLNSWDTGNVTDMSYMFNWATSFTGGVSDWDTGNVTDMSFMFAWDFVFNDDLSGWDVSKVTTLAYTFWNNYVFTGQMGDLSSWDTGNVTIMRYTFGGAKTFNGNVSDWDVSKVTDMQGTFLKNYLFDRDLNWITSNVTNMSRIFEEASIFNRNVSDWDVSKVTDMYHAFKSAKAFSGDLSRWETGKVTNMFRMFEDAVTFNSDISGWDTSRVIEYSDMGMDYMFYGAHLFSQDLSGWCVLNLSRPVGFATNSSMTKDQYPIWGTCP